MQLLDAELCLWLTWNVFDSFEGLPASSSQKYQAGEFSGSLDEVRRNIDIYGTLERVRFYKGFFKKIMKEIELPPLLCIWMDVDLEASARDVMAALPHLNKKSALFSHECASQYFAETISSPQGPNYVVPAILNGFATQGDPVKGRYLCGHTGAFWRAGVGFPVLANEHLMRLLALI